MWRMQDPQDVAGAEENVEVSRRSSQLLFMKMRQDIRQMPDGGRETVRGGFKSVEDKF